MLQVVGEQENYFRAGDTVTQFEKVTDHVYSFRWSWYRNIVVTTDEGLVTTDPFNPYAAKELKRYLDQAFPGQPFHTLIYTHYHLDHTRGGSALHPAQVIAHEKCPQYWRDVDATDVLPPTRLIAGDQTLRIGGVEIQLIYLGKSHTDTLYAIYLPGDRLLFTADFGFVRAIPPVGIPDNYFPGSLAAMERLSTLDFDTFVPSHFGYGRKDDLVAFLGFLKTLRQLTREAAKKYADEGGAFARDAKSLKASFGYVYYPLKAQYGDWHGFKEMILFNIVMRVVGEALGY